MSRTHALNEDDLEELFSRSSGPGGQHVNKVSSRVVLTHIPTGISVAVQDSRSQAANRQLARERLLQTIQDEEKKTAAKARQEREKLRRQKAKRPRKVKERILETKRRRSAIKKQRGRVQDS